MTLGYDDAVVVTRDGLMPVNVTLAEAVRAYFSAKQPNIVITLLSEPRVLSAAEIKEIAQQDDFPWGNSWAMS